MRMMGKPCIGHVNLTNKSKNSSKALLVFICLMLSSIASILMNGTQSIAATLPGENLGTADNLDGDWASATSNQNGASTKSDISELMQTGINNFCVIISLIAFILIALLVHKRRIK